MNYAYDLRRDRGGVRIPAAACPNPGWLLLMCVTHTEEEGEISVIGVARRAFPFFTSVYAGVESEIVLAPGRERRKARLAFGFGL